MLSLEVLTQFFMYATIVSLTIFIIWLAFFKFAPNFTYKMQSNFISLSREQFDLIFYAYLGLYKIFMTVFIIIPYIALLLMSCNGA